MHTTAIWPDERVFLKKSHLRKRGKNADTKKWKKNEIIHKQTIAANLNNTKQMLRGSHIFVGWYSTSSAHVQIRRVKIKQRFGALNRIQFRTYLNDRGTIDIKTALKPSPPYFLNHILIKRENGFLKTV